MTAVMRRATLIVLAVGCVLGTAANSSAADVHLQRVLLLPAADRSSVVFELTAEPQRVSTRRISDSVLLLEAGPGVEGSAVPELLHAPANVRFVESVSVSTTPTDAGSVVRARIALSSAAQAVVRSSGRRVYVDFSAVPSGAAPAAPATAVRAGGAAAAAQPGRASTADAYRNALRPSLDKLHELAPFVTSAAGSPGTQVASALLPGVLAVRSSMVTLQPPDAMRGSHAMLLSAVDGIIAALGADFSGDRAAAMRRSVSTIDVVGAAVVSGELSAR